MPFHQDVHETAMAEGWGGLEILANGKPWWQDDEQVCDRACDDRDAMERSGYDCDCTPVDVLMGDPGLGLNVAWAMEHGDDPPED